MSTDAADVPQHVIGRTAAKRVLAQAFDSPSSSYVARASEVADGVQVDLLLDRADRSITLVEAEFTEEPFALTKAYAQQLREKKGRFRAHTGTRKQVFVVLLTTCGVRGDGRAGVGIVDAVVEVGALMRPGV